MEALEVPHDCKIKMTADDAKAKIKALPAHIDSIDATKTQAFNDFTLINDPNSYTNAAEFGETIKVINQIKAKAQTGWPQVCKQ